MNNIKVFFQNNIKKLIIIIIAAFSILVLCIFSIILYKKNVIVDKNEPIATYDIDKEDIKKETQEEVKKIKVDIKGAVVNPGVYEIDDGAIINDVINLAGGILNNGTTDNINLSRKVSNEMAIIIYKKSDLEKPIKITEDCKTNEINIQSCLDDKKSIIISSNQSKQNDNTIEEEQKLISINTASLEELMTLNGIGHSKAEAIIQYREENGSFKKIEDILNISGIGESILDKIKDFITL